MRRNSLLISRPSLCTAHELFLDVVLFQLPVQCSFTNAEVKSGIFSFALVFFQSLYDEFPFLVHYIETLLYFDMFVYVIMRHLHFLNRMFYRLVDGLHKFRLSDPIGM